MLPLLLTSVTKLLWENNYSANLLKFQIITENRCTDVYLSHQSECWHGTCLCVTQRRSAFFPREHVYMIAAPPLIMCTKLPGRVGTHTYIHTCIHIHSCTSMQKKHSQATQMPCRYRWNFTSTAHSHFFLIFPLLSRHLLLILLSVFFLISSTSRGFLLIHYFLSTCVSWGLLCTGAPSLTSLELLNGYKPLFLTAEPTVFMF